MLQRDTIELDRCPHCGVAHPNLALEEKFQTTNSKKGGLRQWAIYVCKTCGGAVTTVADWYAKEKTFHHIQDIWPETQRVDESVPARAKHFLEEALGCMHTPSAALVMAASSVDAMLKVKELKEGSLYSRIEQAVQKHMITDDMAKWAHDVRLDANDQRHADEEAPVPGLQDAQRAVEFVLTLAQILFVLPSRVQRALKQN
ncbi:DUF4145 domain-containing protein [Pseudomonas sp. MF6784]|uniref:DUF4145 domain-containing protein n=1 Tax=Pseudomonas sp. MF6784 TaxID=2797535 RepID=UPI0018E85A23|nr:DUF4145 domain-containing protein [Pseudomonas sp. MF6784]MBJ2250527.1 DUF4145 domain-containing protein [Pseudomonas sp. MF6784]